MKRAAARFCFIKELLYGYVDKFMKGYKKKSKRKRPESTANKFLKESEEKTLALVKDVLEPLCETEGMELVHLDYQREAGGRILRLYIDKPGGATLEDCVYISRQSGDLLAVYLENMGPYSLEVSSPGVCRPLGKKVDFEKYKGNQAKIRTAHPIKGQKKFKGVILGISEEMVKLSLDDKIVDIPYQEITRAYLVR